MSYKFENWARTYSCQPEKFFVPQDEQELKSIFSIARDSNKKIRFVGSGYSPSDLCCSDQFLISLRSFNKILQVDTVNNTVEVQAGIVVSDLIHQLKQHNLALNIVPSLSHFALAGMISTASHNSGLHHGVTSSYVLDASLMLADGSVVRSSRQHQADLFLASVAGLGSVGAILAVTLQCSPLYALQVRQWNMDFDEALDKMDQIANKSEYSRVFYIPYVDRLIIHDVDRLPPEKCCVEKGIWSRSKNHVKQEWLGYYLLELLMFINVMTKHVFARWFNRWYFYVFYRHTVTYCNQYDKVFTVEVKVKQYASEWAIPLHRVKWALQQLRQLSCSSPRLEAVHFPYEVRFVKGDDLWLSPAYGRTTAFVNIVAFRPYGFEPRHEQLFRRFAAIMQEAGGRPHLAKDHGWTEKEMAAAFPMWRRFKETIKQVDPEATFSSNAYTKRVFGTR